MLDKALYRLNYLSDRECDYLNLLKEHQAIDVNFYKSQNMKSFFAKSFPYIHYVKKGQYKDKYPFKEYSSGKYIHSLYLIEDETLLSPYHAYLKYGEVKESDISNLRENSLYGQKQQAIQTSYDQAFSQLSTSPTSNKIAIILHIYYDEVVAEIMDNIKDLNSIADFFVTYCDHISGEKEQQLLANIVQYYPQAKIIKIPNHGRDIFPFTQWVSKGFLKGYKAVLKLHSKRSKHNVKGDYYRQALISSITPPNFSLNDIQTLVTRDDWGLILHTDFLITEERFWFDNYYLTKKLLKQYQINIDDYPFYLAAGCIYWLSGSMIEKFSQISYNAYDFELEDGQKDATMAHAIERIFTYLAEDRSLKVITL